MATTFWRLGRPLELKLGVHGLRHPVLVLAGIGGAVGLLAALCDIFVFRALLWDSYVRFAAEVPAVQRIVLVGTKALAEEVVFRLVLMSLLVWVASLLWPPRELTYWSAAVLAQVTNVALQSPVPTTPLMGLFIGVRFIAPGVLWGYLYWRAGFAAAAMAHVSEHVVLQRALCWL